MTVSERKRTTRITRFELEKRGQYLVPEGAFESALMVVKEVFSNETLGVSDTSFWLQFEEKATMNPNEACFHYYLAGTGHRTLALNLLNNFGRFRAGVASGDVSRKEKEGMEGRLASRLYSYYPPKYKKEIKR